jgi:hypothetical protein
MRHADPHGVIPFSEARAGPDCSLPGRHGNAGTLATRGKPKARGHQQGVGLVPASPCDDLNDARGTEVLVAADSVSRDRLQRRRDLLHGFWRRLNGAVPGIAQLHQLDLVPIA